jgi:CheY-like chemotaxis protein
MPVLSRVTAHEASLYVASRLARDARSVLPDDEPIRLLSLAYMLEEAAYAGGLDKPLDMADGTVAARVAEQGLDVVQEVLSLALDKGYAAAAAAAAQILGQSGKTVELLHGGSRPTPLVRATWADDRRVRFAAVEAVLRLEPTAPFVGASRVTEALRFFASSGGAPRALVAANSRAEARRIAGYLIALGYDVETAVSGREALGHLLGSADYELAFFGVGLEGPTVDLMLQEVRHDCRTAQLPVGLTARDGQFQRAQKIARRDPLAGDFARPHSEEAVRWQVDRVLELAGRDRVSAAERGRQATQALAWLADWSGRDQDVFDFSGLEDTALTALYAPDAGTNAIAVLGNLGTARCQQTLVDVASRWTLPLELRTSAAQAFDRSVKHNGILLTNKQLLQQYDRYNESENLDPGTQQVLGSILDSIEAPYRASQQQPRPAEDAQGKEDRKPADGNSN